MDVTNICQPKEIQDATIPDSVMSRLPGAARRALKAELIAASGEKMSTGTATMLQETVDRVLIGRTPQDQRAELAKALAEPLTTQRQYVMTQIGKGADPARLRPYGTNVAADTTLPALKKVVDGFTPPLPADEKARLNEELGTVVIKAAFGQEAELAELGNAFRDAKIKPKS